MSKKVLAALIFSAILAAFIAPTGLAFRHGGMGNEFVPEPRLLSPTGEEADLTGRDSMEFRWSPHEGSPTRRDYYDFRLYKGYDMLESTRIFKQRVGPRESGIFLKSGMFEDGAIYTWSLRQVYTGSVKSMKVFQSFRIIKR